MKLNSRDEVKALDLKALFDAAIEGTASAFECDDQQTFVFATQRARTFAVRMGYQGRISVLTDKHALTVTYASGGARHQVAARQRVERKEAEAIKRTGHTVETRQIVGTSVSAGPDKYRLADPSIQEGEAIYTCHADAGMLSVGPAAAPGDDVRCAHCGRTNESAGKEFASGGTVKDDGQIDVDEAPTPTIRLVYMIEDGLAVQVKQSKRQSRRRAQKAELGEHISAAAIKARKERKKKERTSLARRRGR